MSAPIKDSRCLRTSALRVLGETLAAPLRAVSPSTCSSSTSRSTRTATTSSLSAAGPESTRPASSLPSGCDLIARVPQAPAVVPYVDGQDDDLLADGTQVGDQARCPAARRVRG